MDTTSHQLHFDILSTNITDRIEGGVPTLDQHVYTSSFIF